ncbi:hypothetical protein GN109_05850 [Collimonas pratensis]|uniref:hypothetical protein n=1 Tax=Collimonas pratensis TaxID=279113 RepID=UPI00143D102E|nr:hypothetical protein [Collimonas pratensis]NKI68937.1 hypothetical protein [Collimonas pratensis]
MSKFQEEADRIGVPLIGPLPPVRKQDHTFNPTIAICGECGMHLKGVMGYVCVNGRCPTGLAGPQCISTGIQS